MTDNRMGGVAIIAGQVALLITMSLHPSGHDLVAAGSRFGAVALLTAGVHALAIASLPVSFLGALALSRHAASSDRLALAALVLYAVALIAGMSAAAVSGFVAPGLVREILSAQPPESDQWRIVFDYNGRLNQAFAQMLAVASSTAIVLWSAAIVKNRSLPRGVAIYGLLIGPAIVIAVLSGYLALHVHGFGLIVVLEAIWFITVGILLYRTNE